MFDMMVLPRGWSWAFHASIFYAMHFAKKRHPFANKTMLILIGLCSIVAVTILGDRMDNGGVCKAAVDNRRSHDSCTGGKLFSRIYSLLPLE
jgi:hypothetical protein